jgi:hypothetical protein
MCSQVPINAVLVKVNHASQKPRCTKLEALLGAHCGLQAKRGSRLRSYANGPLNRDFKLKG